MTINCSKNSKKNSKNNLKILPCIENSNTYKHLGNSQVSMVIRFRVLLKK